MSVPTIAIGYNTCHYAWMMRANLIRALQESGYHVAVLAPHDEYAEKLSDMGVRVIDLPMRMNKNPITDLLLMYRFRRELARLGAVAYLGYTAKPNIFGTLAATSLGIPAINNIAGLGAGFISGGFVTNIMKQLYRVSLARSSTVFFQNPDDRNLFLSFKLIPAEKAKLLPGSGVDLDRFTATPLPGDDARVSFILIARMLRDKGVGEFVAAAREVKRRHPKAEFRLLGPLGVDNPSAIDEATMQQWVDEGVVTYLGETDDVRPHLAAADCVVLPSFYREGTPRSLLEAGASGRPVITTDMPGCRDTVDDDVNGFICPPRDVTALADRMTRMIEIGPRRRAEMGDAGRGKMEREFDEQIVVDAYRSAITESDASRSTGADRL